MWHLNKWSARNCFSLCVVGVAYIVNVYLDRATKMAENLRHTPLWLTHLYEARERIEEIRSMSVRASGDQGPYLMQWGTVEAGGQTVVPLDEAFADASYTVIVSSGESTALFVSGAANDESNIVIRCFDNTGTPIQGTAVVHYLCIGLPVSA